MAWVNILDSNSNPIGWQYDDAAPGGTAGIRTNWRGQQIYIKCRRTGEGEVDRGEINKTYWDSHNKDTVQAWP